MNAVFDTLLDATVVLDAGRQLIYANDAFLTLCDLPRRKIKPGVKLEEMIRLDDGELSRVPACDWGKTEPTPYRETSFESASGKTGKVQVTVQPDPADASRSRWVLFMRDVGLEEALHSKYRSQLAMKEQALDELTSAHRKLDDYSKNLEKMVQDRTAELRSLNALLGGMLDSLGQGFLLFGRDRRCLPAYSRACERIFGLTPAGRDIAELIAVDPSKATQFGKWVDALFDEKIAFADIAELGPGRYEAKGAAERRHITLEYRPLRNEAGKVEWVILIATDITREQEAIQRAEVDRARVEMILRLAGNREPFLAFVRESLKTLERIGACTEKSLRTDLPEILRDLHTIKGGAGTFFIHEAQRIAHELESRMADVSQAGAGDLKELVTALREGSSRIRAELESFCAENRKIIGRELGDFERNIQVPVGEARGFAAALEAGKADPKLKAQFIEIFFRAPLAKHIGHFQDTIREIAESQGKKVQPLVLEGGDLRIDPEKFGELFLILEHALRNSVDHGLETPAERKESGKPEAGKITIRFSREQGALKVEIEDDGKGIDPGKIRAKLRERGKSSEAENESDEEVIQHVFDDGLSTSEEMSLLSGRGIGMGAVMAFARRFEGSARIFSRKGAGTLLRIELSL